jgi:hypothetical protein
VGEPVALAADGPWIFRMERAAVRREPADLAAAS